MDELLEPDKLGHGYAGSIVFSGSRLACLGLGCSPEEARWLGLGMAILVGISKELYDAQGYGTPEVADAVATALGGAVSFTATIEF